jgi:hypothetical protein
VGTAHRVVRKQTSPPAEAVTSNAPNRRPSANVRKRKAWTNRKPQTCRPQSSAAEATLGERVGCKPDLGSPKSSPNTREAAPPVFQDAKMYGFPTVALVILPPRLLSQPVRPMVKECRRRPRLPRARGAIPARFHVARSKTLPPGPDVISTFRIRVHSMVQ